MNKQEKLVFERDGYVILKNCISKEACQSLMKKSIKPILRKNNLYYTGKQHRKNLTGCFFAGRSGHPIKGKNKSWPAFFKNARLLLSLCDLHPRNQWKWVYGAVNVLGWLHIRYPYTRSRKWQIPKSGWHLDGATDDDKIKWNKSVTIIPLINSITPNGGGTALFKGSHKLINYWIHHLQNRISLSDYIEKYVNREIEKNEKNEKNEKSNIIETNGEQGDILIMHPHMIHSASNCYKKNKIRVTFNLSTEFL